MGILLEYPKQASLKETGDTNRKIPDEELINLYTVSRILGIEINNLRSLIKQSENLKIIRQWENDRHYERISAFHVLLLFKLAQEHIEGYYPYVDLNDKEISFTNVDEVKVTFL